MGGASAFAQGQARQPARQRHRVVGAAGPQQHHVQEQHQDRPPWELSRGRREAGLGARPQGQHGGGQSSRRGARQQQEPCPLGEPVVAGDHRRGDARGAAPRRRYSLLYGRRGDLLGRGRRPRRQARPPSGRRHHLGWHEGLWLVVQASAHIPRSVITSSRASSPQARRASCTERYSPKI